MRILIADDSCLVLERLQSLLGEIDEVEIVASVSNGDDALTAIKTLNPDLAILDVSMPGLSGLEVLKTIRNENKAVIFILITFHSAGYIKQLAIQSGTNHFFNKADDLEQIYHIVRRLSIEQKENNNYK